MAPKTARKPRAQAEEGEQRGFTLTPDLISKPVSTEKVEMQQRRVSAKYAPLINAIMGMKVGETITVGVPKDTTIEKFSATVAATLRKRLSDKLRHGKLSFGKTTDNQLAISIVKA